MMHASKASELENKTVKIFFINEMDALVFEILFGSVIVSYKFSKLFRRGDSVSPNCVFGEVALHSLFG